MFGNELNSETYLNWDSFKINGLWIQLRRELACFPTIVRAYIFTQITIAKPLNLVSEIFHSQIIL